MRRCAVLLTVPLAACALVVAGCGVPSAAGSDGTYRLGFTGTLTGDYASIGVNEANAVKLAVAQANARGDLGFTLGYAESDDAGGGPGPAQRLIEDKSVVAVVGPTFSEQAATAGPLLSEAGLTALSPSATRPQLTASGFTTFFRDVPSDLVQGMQAAEYIAGVVKAKEVYSVNDGTEYANLASALDPRLRELGVAVTSEVLAPTPDYAPVAATIARADPDFVFYSGYFVDLAALATALRSAGYAGPIGSGDGSKDDRLVALGGRDIEGVHLTCPCSDPSAGPDGAAFAAAYQGMFGVAPGSYSAEAYDAANAVIDVLRTLGPGGIDRGRVLAGVRRVDHAGVTKRIRFQTGGDPVESPIFVYQVRSQRIVLSGPADRLAG